jgi:hypothetical protein
MSNPLDPWFKVDRDRRRERAQRTARSQRRAARAAQREQDLQRAFATAPNIEMHVTGWEIDEQGNLSRKVFAK